MQHHQYIAELGPLLEHLEIRHVVLCPGSRNAPLIQLFTSHPSIRCHSIVDERSAAYVALGMARELKQMVAVVTTSGTAVLNLTPAVAEAWHQNIPLLLLTADRPMEKINQFNNQVVDQQAPFFTFTKGFYEVPSRIQDSQMLKLSLGQVKALIQEARHSPAGPVHLNLLVEEPLYETLPQALFKGNDFANLPEPFPGRDKSPFSPEPDPEKKILILLGMGDYSQEESDHLSNLMGSRQVVVIAENIANVSSRSFISNPELILAIAEEKSRVELEPDLVLTFGGQVVSKQLRLFLQSIVNLDVIQSAGDLVSTLKELFPGGDQSPSIQQNLFFQSWDQVRKRIVPVVRKRLDSLPFSNLAAVNRLLAHLPGNARLHLGNSASIRYTQLIPAELSLPCYSNRGTSGIDGCVSTAVGAAMSSNDLHVLLVGDLSFVYDSNALWNKDYPDNLKVVVLNDGGGGIFRLLEGPDRMDFFEEFSVTHHPVSLELLSLSFGRRFKRVNSLEELEDVLSDFCQPGQGTEVLEVDTSGSENSSIFKDFLNLKM